MDADNNLKVDSGGAGAAAFGRPDGARRRNTWPWINWGLTLALVPAAALVMIFALGAVMSTDGCSDRSCPNLGHGGINFGVAFYGAPAVAAVVIIISFYLSTQEKGVEQFLGS